jgi:hypothetical protein
VRARGKAHSHDSGGIALTTDESNTTAPATTCSSATRHPEKKQQSHAAIFLSQDSFPSYLHGACQRSGLLVPRAVARVCSVQRRIRIPGGPIPRTVSRRQNERQKPEIESSNIRHTDSCTKEATRPLARPCRNAALSFFLSFRLFEKEQDSRSEVLITAFQGAAAQPAGETAVDFAPLLRPIVQLFIGRGLNLALTHSNVAALVGRLSTRHAAFWSSEPRRGAEIARRVLH